MDLGDEHMPFVAYKGRHAALDVSGLGRVERGQPVEVDDDTARQLVRQGWRKADKPTESDREDNDR